jgi:hypothetical protein
MTPQKMGQFTVTMTPFWRGAEASMPINGQSVQVKVNQPQLAPASINWEHALAGASPAEVVEFAALLNYASAIADLWTREGFAGE